MKKLNSYIQEKLVINKDSQVKQKDSYQPKTKEELQKIIKERLEKDKDADLNDIDVSGIKDMGRLFDKLDPHNIKIDKWDVSNVKYMSAMFCECSFFNADLSNWDVSRVENMSFMFGHCLNFEGKGLEKWNVSRVTCMDSMFTECTDMFYMFENCYKFNCDLNNWDISNVKDKRGIFQNCRSLQIPKWYKE